MRFRTHKAGDFIRSKTLQIIRRAKALSIRVPSSSCSSRSSPPAQKDMLSPTGDTASISGHDALPTSEHDTATMRDKPSPSETRIFKTEDVRSQPEICSVPLDTRWRKIPNDILILIASHTIKPYSISLASSDGKIVATGTPKVLNALLVSQLFYRIVQKRVQLCFSGKICIYHNVRAWCVGEWANSYGIPWVLDATTMLIVRRESGEKAYYPLLFTRDATVMDSPVSEDWFLGQSFKNLLLLCAAVYKPNPSFYKELVERGESPPRVQCWKWIREQRTVLEKRLEEQEKKDSAFHQPDFRIMLTYIKDTDGFEVEELLDIEDDDQGDSDRDIEP